ncbi:alpha/beta hydrolase [Mycobacteroides abscessus]|uniref:alpha/beta hydrolase n=1 Tax=Mycobacteroides abscessus TaxID=36809 RepID=UPI00138FD7C6|nr:alpha/beta hydrolase [Mycobacteroides abscessus]
MHKASIDSSDHARLLQSAPASDSGRGYDSGRQLAGWTALVAAALAWFTIIATEIAAGFDLQMFFDPKAALSMSSAATWWFRASLVADSFSFYLPFLIIGGYLWRRLRKDGGALTDIATLSTTVYVILGVSGASIQFAAVGPLARAYSSADATVRAGAEVTWLGIVYSAQLGLWWFEGPVMAFWALVIALQLRRSQSRPWRSLIVVGALYTTYFLAELSGVRVLADIAKAAAVSSVPVWLLLFGVVTLRDKSARSRGEALSLRASMCRQVVRRVIAPVLAADSEPAAKRAKLDRLSRLNELSTPSSVEVQRAKLGGVPVEWVKNRSTAIERHILYFHGGGYLVGSPITHRRLTVRLAKACNAAVAVVDYRLAPEHPFPAAPIDALIAYQCLIENDVPPEQIVIAGDSAGAGLALACALQARAADLPMPAGLVCLSPWTDLSLSGTTIQTNKDTDFAMSPDLLGYAARQYVIDGSLRQPLASPQFADLTGLPPILIQVSDNEILYSDATGLAANALSANVEVELDVAHDLWHVWHTFAGQMPEADEGVRGIADFISRRTANCASACDKPWQ